MKEPKLEQRTKDISTGYWIADGFIWGPTHAGQVKIEGNKIIVPGSNENYSMDKQGKILHNGKDTGYHVDKETFDFIDGPSEKLPWQDHLDEQYRRKLGLK